MADIRVIVNAEAAEVDPEPLHRAALHVVSAEGRDAGEISVTLLPDDDIRTLNREYLERDYVTDVIAFSLGDDDTVLGDVYIGFEQARRQAAEFGAEASEELLRLVVHGVLHVLGHDHPDGDDRVESPMFERQESLLLEILTG